MVFPAAVIIMIIIMVVVVLLIRIETTTSLRRHVIPVPPMVVGLIAMASERRSPAIEAHRRRADKS